MNEHRLLPSPPQKEFAQYLHNTYGPQTAERYLNVVTDPILLSHQDRIRSTYVPASEIKVGQGIISSRRGIARVTSVARRGDTILVERLTPAKKISLSRYSPTDRVRLAVEV